MTTSLRIISIIISAVFFIFVLTITNFLIPPKTHAQLNVGGQNIQIQTDPAYPGVFEPISVSLEANALNIAGASIVWFINGVEVLDFENQNTITLNTGTLGETLNMRANLTFQDGTTLSVNKTILPSEIDIITETATLVPPFYGGRALPSAGAPIRVTAMPALNGRTDYSELQYTWKLNNTILLGGPVVGAQSIVLTTPDSPEFVSVTIASPTGEILSQKGSVIEPVDPELYFYEENPLRGMIPNAISNTIQLEGEEISIRGVPYFSSTPPDSQTEYLWNIDGQPVDNGNTDQELLTLRKTGGSGIANIDFTFAHPTNFQQYARGSFNISFEDIITDTTFGL